MPQSSDSLGIAEQLILRVELEHDVERAHPLISRVLFEQNDDASDGQIRVTDLQHKSDSVLQLGCWGEDVASEAWYNQRAEVDQELGTVAVADGERDDAGANSIVCFPAVVISFGVESSLNSRILSFSPRISSSSRNDSDAPLSTSNVALLVLGMNRLVAAAVDVKPPSKSLLLPAKLMTGFSLSGDSLSLAATVVSPVDLLCPEEQCAQLAHARETLAFLFGRVAVRGGPVGRAPLCCSVWLVLGLKFGPVSLGVPALLALEAVDVVIRRCLGRHGGATPGYASLHPVPRLLVEKHMSHGGLHVVDVEGRVAVHHHIHILVLIGEARDADVLELPVGYLFSHLLDPDADKTLLVEVVVWVLSRLRRRVHELLHDCADDLMGDLVVVAAEDLEGCLPVAADLAFILVLLDTEGCW